jgi:hypothetical protein
VIATRDRIAQILQAERELRAIDAVAYCCVLYSSRGWSGRVSPPAVCVMLKTMTCVCSCGAAYPSTGRALSCSNRAAIQRPVTSGG